jgi:hypothetical protein
MLQPAKAAMEPQAGGERTPADVYRSRRCGCLLKLLFFKANASAFLSPAAERKTEPLRCSLRALFKAHGWTVTHHVG